jgi:signal transduction histidine kinase/CheY-like chemotaxis protein
MAPASRSLTDFGPEPGAPDVSAATRVYAAPARLFTAVMAIYYCLMVVAHVVILDGAAGFTMAALAGVTAVVALYLRFAPLRRAASVRTIGFNILVLEALVVANVTTHGVLLNDPGQITYLLMMAFAFALLGPTLAWVNLALTMVGAAAATLTLTGPAEDLVSNAFLSATAVIGSWFAARWIHDAVHGQAEARARAELLLMEVEAERLRVEDLAHEAAAASRAKSEFLSTMSHELRTPLNGVVGIASALKATPLTPQQAEMVALIEGSGRTLSHLLSDILDFSKIEAGRIEIDRAPFDLAKETRAIASLMFPGAAEGVATRLDIAPACGGTVCGDAVRLKQIVANLVSNAIKFTRAGEIAVTLRRDGDDVELRVSDTGVGFESHQADRLFQRFTQADSSITRRYGGTGLGLAITKALCEAMGGTIKAEGQPGVGATFIVRLPLPPLAVAVETPVAPTPASAPIAPTPALAEARAAPATRILLVEDHPTNRKVVELILSPLDVELIQTEDGAQALAAIEAGPPFDVVLMDMQMPVMDGLAATRAIRAREAALGLDPVPVIMLTANAMAEHRAAAHAAGADLHVAKPVTPAGLIEAITRVAAGESERVRTPVETVSAPAPPSRNSA